MGIKQARKDNKMVINNGYNKWKRPKAFIPSYTALLIFGNRSKENVATSL